jgi:hypothetical protein
MQTHDFRLPELLSLMGKTGNVSFEEKNKKHFFVVQDQDLVLGVIQICVIPL